MVDYGFAYQHVDQEAHADATDRFQMKSGQNSGSRFGLKGVEDLGNGLKVGFVLENGFTADDGVMDNGGRLFGRESQLFVQGDFGTLSFGRVGQLLSGLGSFGLMSKYSVFSGGWGSYTGGKFTNGGAWGRMDNTITYASPEFAGAKFYAQYSFKLDSKQFDAYNNDVVTEENKSKSDRYASIAMTYDIGALSLLIEGDWTQLGNIGPASESSKWIREMDDSWGAMVAGTYDFGVMKLYASGQWFKNTRTKFTDDWTTIYGLQGSFTDYVGAAGGANTLFVDGYAFNLGADVPAFGGTFKANIGYRYNECVRNSKNDVERWAVSAGYVYDLSKRTTVYGAATYVQDDLGKLHTRTIAGGASSPFKYVDDPSAIEAMVGLIHKF